MSLDMTGHIDDIFETDTGTRTPNTREYVEGLPLVTEGKPSPHSVTLQPATPKQIEALESGGERFIDVRNVWVNDGDLYSITPSDVWNFDSLEGDYKTVKLDNRPVRNYCKITVAIKDEG